MHIIYGSPKSLSFPSRDPPKTRDLWMKRWELVPESTWRTDRSERTDPKEMSVRSGAPGMGSQGRIPTDVGDTPWCSHGDPLGMLWDPFSDGLWDKFQNARPFLWHLKWGGVILTIYRTSPGMILQVPLWIKTT